MQMVKLSLNLHGKVLPLTKTVRVILSTSVVWFKMPTFRKHAMQMLDHDMHLRCLETSRSQRGLSCWFSFWTDDIRKRLVNNPLLCVRWSYNGCMQMCSLTQCHETSTNLPLVDKSTTTWLRERHPHYTHCGVAYQCRSSILDLFIN